MSSERIADEEILYRRIPPGERWFEPPDRITSANFKLGTNEDGTKEEGLSVYRASIVTPAEVLEKPNAIPGSRIACAEAGKIRALQGGDKKPGHKKPLHLDVVIVNDEDDPGHAEIRGPAEGKLSRSASQALKKLFRLLSDQSQTGSFSRP